MDYILDFCVLHFLIILNVKLRFLFQKAAEGHQRGKANKAELLHDDIKQLWGSSISPCVSVSSGFGPIVGGN